MGKAAGRRTARNRIVFPLASVLSSVAQLLRCMISTVGTHSVEIAVSSPFRCEHPPACHHDNARNLGWNLEMHSLGSWLLAETWLDYSLAIAC